MNNYYYDPKTNTLHGPLDRMPPVWDYGFPPDGPSDSQLASAEADFDDAWKSFNTYLQTVPSHPHTFTGESRVVPEGEIEWEYCNCKVGNDCPYRKGKWFSPCRVATPKVTGEPSIPAHIVDDMKLDSYYDGFKDGAKITGEPDTDQYSKRKGESPWPFNGYAPGNYENKCSVCKEYRRGMDKLSFVCLECAVKIAERQQPPPSPSQEQRVFIPGNIHDFMSVLQENYEAAKHGDEECFYGTTKREAVVEIYEDLIFLYRSHLAAQQPHSPALQGEKPKKICYCGSLRVAKEAFQKAEYESVLKGDIALLPCCMFVDIQREYGAESDYKQKADDLHKRKIDICDEVFVLNVGGYIGESTRSEIEYATKIGKPIKYLEP